MPFISSSCLIAMGMTSSTVCSKNENGQPCLVLDLKGNADSICSLSMMLAMVCYIWPLFGGLFPLLHFAERFGFFFFNHKWVLDFIKCFFCIYWYGHVIFILHFVYVVYQVYWFANIVPTLHPQNESQLIMVFDLINVLLDMVC